MLPFCRVQYAASSEWQQAASEHQQLSAQHQTLVTRAEMLKHAVRVICCRSTCVTLGPTLCIVHIKLHSCCNQLLPAQPLKAAAAHAARSAMARHIPGTPRLNVRCALLQVSQAEMDNNSLKRLLRCLHPTPQLAASQPELMHMMNVSHPVPLAAALVFRHAFVSAGSLCHVCHGAACPWCRLSWLAFPATSPCRPSLGAPLPSLQPPSSRSSSITAACWTLLPSGSPSPLLPAPRPWLQPKALLDPQLAGPRGAISHAWRPPGHHRRAAHSQSRLVGGPAWCRQSPRRIQQHPAVESRQPWPAGRHRISAPRRCGMGLAWGNSQVAAGYYVPTLERSTSRWLQSQHMNAVLHCLEWSVSCAGHLPAWQVMLPAAGVC